MGQPYAICRTAKIKTLSGLKAHAGHAARTRETLNADSFLSQFNPVLIGSGDPVADAESRLAILPKPPRKNGVLAIDVLLTASPEYFRPGEVDKAGLFDADRLEAFNEKAVEWVKAYFGKENVVSAICHIDENTCHISGTVVPLIFFPRKKGHPIRLNASHWLDGKKKLQAMQDSFAEAMRPLGLQRGQKGSTARHQDVKRYYGEMKEYPRLKAENAALRGQVKASGALTQAAYKKGRVVEKKKASRLIGELQFQVTELTKLTRLYRRLLPDCTGAVGILLEDPTSNQKTNQSQRGIL